MAGLFVTPVRPPCGQHQLNVKALSFSVFASLFFPSLLIAIALLAVCCSSRLRAFNGKRSIGYYARNQGRDTHGAEKAKREERTDILLRCLSNPFWHVKDGYRWNTRDVRIKTGAM